MENNAAQPFDEGRWKQKLRPEQYQVMRLNGTEAPFSGKLLHNKDTGTYTCGACGSSLFSSDAKFESGTGWPSFFQPINKANVELKEDVSYGMRRTEVTCARCGSHLGHVFDDGPPPTGQRYCMNSVALEFRPQQSTGS